ncbi:2TM domain-containing protein [Flavobacterium kingsejongi]|uniref:Histidine kinase n=1 Tax=Flavobacterium kingsejongi TaxID=1678728 RepID=A0A2S1LQ87_9FLAO|nr:2TM domain-containing protein [Flavobacterium kingsejongi]AWG25920.1 histidine kinase [Flavobacterium kingsejongi]
MEIKNTFENQRLERARRRVKKIAGFYRHLLIYILVNLFLVTLEYFRLETGESFFTFNTFSTAFFWGIGLFFHAFNVFGPNLFLGSDWEERKIRELMKKEEQQKWS